MNRMLAVLLSACLLAGCTSASSLETKPSGNISEAEGENLYENATEYEDTETKKVYLSLVTAGRFSGNYHGEFLQKRMNELNQSGNFDIVLYEDGILGNDRQLFQAVQEGALSIVMMSPAVQQDLIPELQLLEIPWFFEDNADYQDFMNQSGCRFFEPLYEKHGLVLLGISISDYRYLTTKRPIEKIEDFQGMKIRIQDNECHKIIWEALGAEPQVIDFSDLYMSLYNGVVDAQENPLIVIQSKRLYDVQDYIIDTGYLPTIYSYVINKEQWDEMTSQEQQELRGMFDNYISDVVTSMPQYIETEMQSLIRENGMTVLTPNEQLHTDMLRAQDAVEEHIRSQIGEAEMQLYLSLSESYRRTVLQ